MASTSCRSAPSASRTWCCRRSPRRSAWSTRARTRSTGSADHIGTKCILLVLDNFEQVNDAAPQIAELLVRAARISILVTSRSPLRVYGEQEYPVPPLGVPDPKHLPDLEKLSTYESVALFVERAMAVRPDFAVTSANAPAVAEICVRLDGLPLAIELAAARVRVLSPQAIMERLGDRLKLLSGGSRDLPERQQTLRGAIAWSHDLLDADDQRVFARFSVFAGGATLDAVERVVFDPGEASDALDADGLARRQEPGPAGERAGRRAALPDAEHHPRVRDREAGRARRGRGAGEPARRPGWSPWSRRAPQRSSGPTRRRSWTDTSASTTTSAPRWHGPSAHEHAEMAMRILAACWRFWQMRGYLAEAREHAERVLAMPGTPRPPRPASRRPGGRRRDRLLAGRPGCRAPGWYEEALEIARASGDESRIANAIYNLGFTFTSSTRTRSRRRTWRRSRSTSTAAWATRRGSAGRCGASPTPTTSSRTSRAASRRPRRRWRSSVALGDRFMIGWCLYMLGVYNLTHRPIRHAGCARRGAAALHRDRGQVELRPHLRRLRGALLHRGGRASGPSGSAAMPPPPRPARGPAWPR